MDALDSGEERTGEFVNSASTVALSAPIGTRIVASAIETSIVQEATLRKDGEKFRFHRRSRMRLDLLIKSVHAA